MQTSVVIVKPAGTGILSKFISAKFAPLPPSRFFISAVPSASWFPNRYTYFKVIAPALFIIIIKNLVRSIGSLLDSRSDHKSTTY